MKDLNNFITGGTLTAADFVIPMSELQNVVEGTGQTLSAGDLDQLGKGIADYVANGDFYTDSGSADAYVLTEIGSKQAPTAYTNGMRVRCEVANANTGASTVNVAGLGVKNIRLPSGSSPGAGDINGRTELIYDSANNRFELQNAEENIISEVYDINFAISSGGTITVSHGLSAEPKIIYYWIECTTAQANYSIGDKTLVSLNSTILAENRHTAIIPTATQIQVRFSSGSSVFTIADKNTGVTTSATNGSWRFYMRAFA